MSEVNTELFPKTLSTLWTGIKRLTVLQILSKVHQRQIEDVLLLMVDSK